MVSVSRQRGATEETAFCKNNYEAEGKQMNRKHMPILALGLAVLMTVACWTPTADAQRRGGPQLDPEKAAAAWQLQAESVAKDLKLSKENAGKVTEAYKASRKTYQEATKKLSEEQSGGDGQGGRGRGRYQAFRELQQKERDNLKKALGAILKEEQVVKALASLGSFNRSWDRYVDTLAGLGLDKEALSKALAKVTVFVVDSGKAMEEAMANQDYQSMREKRGELKEALDTALAGILSEEQQTKWKEATTRGSRRG